MRRSVRTRSSIGFEHIDGLGFPRVHILVLTDRDWTHPQGGGTGTNLFGQVSRWLAWGHRVSVIGAGYEGAEAVERIGDLTMYRIGGGATGFPRPIWGQWGGKGPGAGGGARGVHGVTVLAPPGPQ